MSGLSKELEALVGEWTMEATPPEGPPWPGGGHLRFEWLEEGVLLLQRWTVELPEAPDGVAVIGWDAEKGTVYQLYTDERDVQRVYEMSLVDGEWRMWREGSEPFPQRFIARIADDGQRIEGRWERRSDAGEWEVDFHVVYRRVSADRGPLATPR
jgi:hypothetical protein